MEQDDDDATTPDFQKMEEIFQQLHALGVEESDAMLDGKRDASDVAAAMRLLQDMIGCTEGNESL